MTGHVVGSESGEGPQRRPAPAGPSSLAMLQVEATRAALSDLLGKASAWVDRMEAEHPPEPPTQAQIELLEAITSDPEAKEAWRLVGDRVRSGATTWTTVWLSPDYGVTGQELKLEVARRMMAAMDFSDVPDAEPRS